MSSLVSYFLLLFVFSLSQSVTPSLSDLQYYLDTINYNLAILYNKQVENSWKNEVYSDLDQESETAAEEQAMKNLNKYIKTLTEETKKLGINSITDEGIKEQLMKLPKLGYDALNDRELKELHETTSNMSSIYRRVNLCSYRDQNSCNLTLIPDVQDILHYSNDVQEIEYYWYEWRTKTGSEVRDQFAKFVKLYRKTAKLNGFSRASDFWFKAFGKSNAILPKLGKMMEQLRPLFKEFHARVRSFLRQQYGSDLIKSNWPYPQHLAEKYIGAAFRDQEGESLNLPFPEKGMPNITEALMVSGYSPKSLFNIADSFYTSIGFPELSNEFWEQNSDPKADPDETYLTCWDKAFHYYSSEVVLLSYCPNVDYRRLLNMFEAVSTVHYYKQFKVQPTVFQNEPLPDFADSIGKIFSLSASTPRYLEKIGVLPVGSFDGQSRMNRLYFLGFKDVLVLPILYILDKYRVDIMDNEIQTWDNCAYWNLNEKYTGAIPPFKRSNRDFDAPSKLLVAVDEVYSGIIIGTIVQYQVYKHLCEKVGEYEKGNPNLPLDYCDLSGHPEIGETLKKAMSLGSSKSWTNVLEVLTDGQELSLDGFLEYYEPLFNWLIESNKLNGAEVGWKESKQCEK